VPVICALKFESGVSLKKSDPATKKLSPVADTKARSRKSGLMDPAVRVFRVVGGKGPIKNLDSGQPERNERACGQVPLVGGPVRDFISNPGMVAEVL